MARLGFVLAGLVVLAALAVAVSFFDDQPAWAQVAQVDSLLSAIVALGVIGAFLAAGGRWLSLQVVRGPMRRAWRRTSPDSTASADDVIARVVEVAQSAEPRPGRLLASVVAIGEADSRRRWPWEAVNHQRWFREVSSRLSDGLVTRLFAPDSAKAVASLAQAVARSLEDVLHFRVVPLATLRRKRIGQHDVLFRDAATALSGAIVLADAVHGRAGAARGMRVWHSTSSRPAGPKFGDVHALGARALASNAQECPWGVRLAAQSRSLAGDFDGRVLDLDGVAVVQDDRAEGVDFLLLTRETCYAATEVIAAGEDLRCKGLTESESQDRPPAWSIDHSQTIARRTDPQRSRLCLVTAFANVVLHYPTDGGTRHSLVFSRRSRQTRNGAGVLSVAGGGVVNLPVGDSPGDEDADGFPDLAVSVCRELKEELGLDVPPAQAVPTAVYLLNERGPNLDSSGKGRGQLVATAAFTITVPRSFRELCATQVYASPSKGAYELVELVEVPLPSLADFPDAQDPARAAADCFTGTLHDAHGGVLDQRAYLAALYASAERYGMAATVAAFVHAWGGCWWAQPWDPALEPTPAGAHRFAVPMDSLLDTVAVEGLHRTADALGIPLAYG